MRVLVTGGSGFVGSHLVDRLVAEHPPAGALHPGGRQEQVARRALVANKRQPHSTPDADPETRLPIRHVLDIAIALDN